MLPVRSRGGLTAIRVRTCEPSLVKERGSCLSRQDEEGSLAGILRIVEIRQRPATDAQHHRTVPFDQDGERSLVADSDKARKQFAIGQFAVGVYGRHLTQMLQNTVKRQFGHGS